MRWVNGRTVLVLSSIVAVLSIFARYLPQGEEAPSLAQGQAVYQEHCAACHGADLEGQPDWRSRRADGRLPAPPHDESGHTWHHSDEELFAITKYGIQHFAGPDYPTDMPAFGDILSDEEIRAVLAYIKSTWPPHIQAQQERRNR
ncbi:cytochrome c [Telmatospirillum sp. J64-1]|uniref:c-type cytochrome n=1 Tax=Telmatospirillum sp. J64-1 TaxID=2502183 RepID=UPI00115D750A|nr:cytochrome c [Telmatospirillum sp. J64-1]